MANEYIHSDVYPKILKRVNLGDTISKACKFVGCSRKTLYNNMSEQDKTELKLAKAKKRDKKGFFDSFLSDNF
jgi:hypothetical protein